MISISLLDTIVGDGRMFYNAGPCVENKAHPDLLADLRRQGMAHRIPIHQDDLSFEERQSKIWEDMEKDMERRRKEWESEIDNMRTDFFHVKPDDNKLESMTDRLGIADSRTSSDAQTSIEKDQNGQPVYRAVFNVKDYKPDEVNVKMDADKLIVNAKHEEKKEGKSVCREFSREVNIPREVDPMSLGCTISSDGILTVEAPLPTPQYPPLTDNRGAAPRIIPTATPSVAAAPPPPAAPSGGTNPTTHTSTFKTFMSPKGAASPSVGTTNPTHSLQFTPQTFSTSNVASSKFDTRSSSGSPANTDGERKYRVEIDIEDFKPEELTIKTVDQKLIISARREERIGTRTSTKELNREISLPDTVEPTAVKAFFSDSGKLLIEAPYLKPLAVGHYSQGREGSPMTGR
ncbi:major egg antigen-like isoform X2 [Mizuhopecten yessoensis]|uniref:major egg antigen-like isoform X2 n=1 Tax=Mizuhopecten yessoensis TaxID=6573 RepID=UPI000B457645|nr:major egg antigen-like isoform X2 [Mizuhopecten yessoensis]